LCSLQWSNWWGYSQYFFTCPFAVPAGIRLAWYGVWSQIYITRLLEPGTHHTFPSSCRFSSLQLGRYGNYAIERFSMVIKLPSSSGL
jgi:hypothetical protein